MSNARHTPDLQDLPPIVERKGGFFVAFPDGKSGPWFPREAAEAAQRREFKLAREIENTYRAAIAAARGAK